MTRPRLRKRLTDWGWIPQAVLSTSTLGPTTHGRRSLETGSALRWGPLTIAVLAVNFLIALACTRIRTATALTSGDRQVSEDGSEIGSQFRRYSSVLGKASLSCCDF